MNYAQSRRSALHAMMEGSAGAPSSSTPPGYGTSPHGSGYGVGPSPHGSGVTPHGSGVTPHGYADTQTYQTGYAARAYGHPSSGSAGAAGPMGPYGGTPTAGVPVGPDGTLVPVVPVPGAFRRPVHVPEGYAPSRTGVAEDGHLTYKAGTAPRFRRPGEGAAPSGYYGRGAAPQAYAPVQAETNWSTERGPLRQRVDPSAAYRPQERLATTKPFVLFIKTPAMIEIDLPDGRKEKIPDGSANIGHIYNKLPHELRQHIQVHNLDSHPYKPPGLTGVPQLYDATRGDQGSYIPFGTQTVVKFLVMVRLMGVEVRMAELHPSGAKLDQMANQLLQRQTQERKRQGRGGPAAYRAESLSNWQRKIMQNEKNPYDPSLKADTGEGGLLLDAAPAMSDHLAEIAYVDIFETGGTNEDDQALKLGVPLDRFDDVGYIDEDALMAVRKLSDEDLASSAGQREDHMLKLMHKIRPPPGGASSQLKGYGPKELMTH